jgi:hypothetical protein
MTTLPETVIGGNIFVKTSFDGGNTFTHPGFITGARSIKQTASQNAEEVVDISNQLAPATTVRTAKSNDSAITGAGMFDANSVAPYLNWNGNNVALPCKFMMDLPPGSVGNTLTISGNYFLSDLSIAGDFGKLATMDVTYAVTGVVTYTIS